MELSRTRGQNGPIKMDKNGTRGSDIVVEDFLSPDGPTP